MSGNELRLWIGDGLALFGTAILVLSVYGIVRMPDIYSRLQAASKAGVAGVTPILLAVALLGGGELLGRTILVGAFLLLTTPVSAHILARAAFLTGEETAPGTRDETKSMPGGGSWTSRP